MLKERDNNKGFSLVELIIVVAIMAVFMSMIAVSYFIVGRANMKSVSSDFNQALGNAQTNTMGRMDNYDVYITVNASTGEATFRVGTNGEENTFANEKIPVKVWNGSEYIVLNANMRISFSKSSGAVKDVRIGCSADGSGGERLGGATGISEYKFLFGDEAGKHYVVHLIKATGKHYVE